jgi:hypothetical protein
MIVESSPVSSQKSEYKDFSDINRAKSNTTKNKIDFYNYDVKRNNIDDPSQASYRFKENSSRKYNVFEE